MKALGRPTVPEVRERVSEYYCRPGNGVGGSLHIAIDDGNMETSHLEFCRQCALERDDTEGVAIADLLLQMTMTQRTKVYKTHQGYEYQRARGIF
jgi:hypothetical protein